MNLILWEVNQERWPAHPIAKISEAEFTTVMLLYLAMDWIASTALMDSLLFFPILQVSQPVGTQQIPTSLSEYC